MIYTKFDIPSEFSEDRTFYATVWTNGSYKTMLIELDEDDEHIIDIGCTCKANIIKAGQLKDQIMCKHLKDFKEKIKSLGYLK